MNKLGGRKYLLAIACIVSLWGIFIYMAGTKMLTADKCMVFVTTLPILMGLFITGNLSDKYIDKIKGEKNGKT